MTNKTSINNSNSGIDSNGDDNSNVDNFNENNDIKKIYI